MLIPIQQVLEAGNTKVLNCCRPPQVPGDAEAAVQGLHFQQSAPGNFSAALHLLAAPHTSESVVNI